jgi:branched-chain amino acid aminotransferase
MYLTWFEGQWLEGNAPLMGAEDHAVWLGSSVFDGARAIHGCVPDLDLHLQRVIESSKRLGLECNKSVPEMRALVKEALDRLPKGADYYIRPLVFGGDGLLVPTNSRFAMTLFTAPLPPFGGFSACLSPMKRADPSMAPTDAKASCLYPNTTRALRDAKARGFDNAVVCDPSGNVAEFATSNLFFVAENGEVTTPVANGTFLSGITRARVIKLLAAEGITVHERSVAPDELDRAKEIFNTGNYGKVGPCTRYNIHELPIGPIATLARERYMAFADGERI